MVRSELKRETLVRNIKQAIRRSRNGSLPATIKEVYAFGGILRGKEKAHDFDAYFLYDLTPQQEVKWAWFCCGFGRVCSETQEALLKKTGVDSEELRNKVYEVLGPYLESTRAISLRKIATANPVAEELRNLGVEPTWVGCFSWTEVLHSPVGIFIPSIEKVLHAHLLRGMRGLQVFFMKYDANRQRFSWPSKNYRLVWSAEKPDIDRNLELSKEEKLSILKSELDSFLEQRAQLREKCLKIQKQLTPVAKECGVKIGFRKLASRHTAMRYDRVKPHDELRMKCEWARQEMRAYQEEEIALRNLLSSIRNYQARTRKDASFLSSYQPQDLVTYWTLLRTNKSNIKEERLREILKDLGLPENHIVTIRHIGRTDHKLEPDESKRRRLLDKAETALKERKLTFKIRKILAGTQLRGRVYVKFDEENKTIRFAVYEEPSEDDRTNDLFVTEWERRGFKTTKSEWTLSALRSFRLKGDETLPDIEDLLGKALEISN